MSKKDDVPMGKELIAEYIVICRKVHCGSPEVFIAKIDDIRCKITQREKNGKKSYWLEIKDYENFKGWDEIGEGGAD